MTTFFSSSFFLFFLSLFSFLIIFFIGWGFAFLSQLHCRRASEPNALDDFRDSTEESKAKSRAGLSWRQSRAYLAALPAFFLTVSSVTLLRYFFYLSFFFSYLVASWLSWLNSVQRVQKLGEAFLEKSSYKSAFLALRMGALLGSSFGLHFC